MMFSSVVPSIARPRTLAFGLGMALLTAAAYAQSLAPSAPMPAPTAVTAAAAGNEVLAASALELMQADELPVQLLRNLVLDAVQQARAGMKSMRYAPEVAEATLRDINKMAAETLQELEPLIRKASHDMRPKVVPLVQAQYSDEELTQLITFLESPVRRKLDQLLPEVQKQLTRHTTDQVRPLVDPKLRALSAAISQRLAQVTPSAPSTSTNSDKKP